MAGHQQDGGMSGWQGDNVGSSVKRVTTTRSASMRVTTALSTLIEGIVQPVRELIEQRDDSVQVRLVVGAAHEIPVNDG
jgi:hypothetical protein